MITTYIATPDIDVLTASLGLPRDRVTGWVRRPGWPLGC